MTRLSDIVAFCDNAVKRAAIVDFPGAANGLQVANNGTVSKIGATVDAGLIPFQQAIARGIDLLIVHHGLFWQPWSHLTGTHLAKATTLIHGNLAVYSSHLPLDAHPTIGNNALIAKHLELPISDWFLEHQGTLIGVLSETALGRETLRQQLQALFPETYQGLEFGPPTTQQIAICSGSGASAFPEVIASAADTFITGELRQAHFNLAQENNLNVYPCGHYATETFGVKALAQVVADEFGLNWEFIDTACPL